MAKNFGFTPNQTEEIPYEQVGILLHLHNEYKTREKEEADKK